MTKTTVVYHRADFDGLFCREIAKKFMPEAELIGWDYGDPLLDFPKEGTVYVLDLSPDSFKPFSCDDSKRLIWIDHHKTAIEKWPSSIQGYRIDGVAACRLAWQWFNITQHNAWNQTNEALQVPLPNKSDFIKRNISEPFAVCLAGEYDIWDKHDERAELFQHGLRSEEPKWGELLVPDPEGHLNQYVQKLLDQGRALQYAKTQENESIIKACGFDVELDGFKLLACNAARYNSQLFKAGLREDHHGCIGFNWDGKQWRVSLYTDRPEVDLSPVAVKYGGGGHRGACGFRCATLPFKLEDTLKGKEQ